MEDAIRNTVIQRFYEVDSITPQQAICLYLDMTKAGDRRGIALIPDKVKLMNFSLEDCVAIHWLAEIYDLWNEWEEVISLAREMVIRSSAIYPEYMHSINTAMLASFGEHESAERIAKAGIGEMGSVTEWCHAAYLTWRESK